MRDDGALLLFSGGQDSATCLAWALANFRYVETVGFAYGQRHEVEMRCREDVRMAVPAGLGSRAGTLGADHVVETSGLAQVADSALTEERAIEMADDGLPTTFVPGRNLVFLTYAAALGYRRGLRHVVGGMCETDYSGYPDCRDDTVKAMQVALNLGMAARFVLHTPLMWRDKAATWALAERLGGSDLVEAIRLRTHTCYRGERSTEHAWGYGCGTCPACELRAEGWRRYRAGEARDDV